MELIVSVIGIILCLRKRRRLKFFLTAFVIMLVGSGYMIMLQEDILIMLHDIGYDSNNGLFRLAIFWIPLIFNLGFYGFLLLGIKNLTTSSSNG